MTPYIKKIVELHKIHKAIEDKDCCNGGGNTPSGDVTIDDVVKFIHDNWNSTYRQFPYTTWDSIPNYEDVDIDEICKNNDYNNYFSIEILSIENEIDGQSYIIGVKGELPFNPGGAGTLPNS